MNSILRTTCKVDCTFPLPLDLRIGHRDTIYKQSVVHLANFQLICPNNVPLAGTGTSTSSHILYF